MLLIATPVLIALGLSQLYATRYWQSYYDFLSSLGQNGVRLNGVISLAAGGVVVAFHNVWAGPPLLLTLIGWLLLVESILCLAVPSAGLTGLSEMGADTRARIVKGTGVFLIIVAGVLGVHVLTAAG